MNPVKQKYLKGEIQYLLKMISLNQAKASCILISKPGGSYRVGTDYRKVNNLSKTGTFPIPRMVDCIDKIVNSKYITKIDFLKRFWQTLLTEIAKEISALLLLMDYITIK